MYYIIIINVDFVYIDFCVFLVNVNWFIIYFYFVLWNNYKSINVDFVYIDYCFFLLSVI